MLVLGEDVGKLGRRVPGHRGPAGGVRRGAGLRHPAGRGGHRRACRSAWRMAGWRAGRRRCSSTGSPTRRWTRSSATSPSTGTAPAGRQPMPMVIRIPFAGGIGAAEHHSESPETYYAHTAGLKVVIPSSPLDAYHLLRASIADPDPVIFFEPKSRYWSKEEGDLDGRTVGSRSAWPAWSARDRTARSSRTGPWSPGRWPRPRLAERGVDVRGARPPLAWSPSTWTRSPTRCAGRGGPSVVARGADDRRLRGRDRGPHRRGRFDYLEAPVLRVTGYDTPYPPATIEAHYLPSVERILAAVDRVVGY